MHHILWKDQDENIPPQICDRNGQVALAQCKVCGQAESELEKECPGRKMKITKIDILQIQGNSEYVYLTTNLPNPLWPFDNNLMISFQVVKGTGEEYVKTNFPGIEYKIKSDKNMKAK